MSISDAVVPKQISLLKELFEKSYLKFYYLVGDTNLAMQYSHRKSGGLDLFSNQELSDDISYDLHKKLTADFDERYVSEKITKVGVFCYIDNIKVDLVNYPFPMLKAVIKSDGYNVADIEDVAAMKIKTIATRGTKKDFYDLFELLHHISLDQILQAYKRKYSTNNLNNVKISLGNFADAEKSDNTFNTVVSLKNISWEKIKNFIIQSVKKEFNQSK